MNVKKIVIGVGIALFSLAVICALAVLGLAIYIKTNIDFESDEILFSRAAVHNSTTFFRDAYPSDDEYTPVELEISGGLKKIYYSLDEIPEVIKKGILDVEDRKFYQHNGVDFRRTVFALANYIFKKENRFGASTITQQVIKNISGDNEITLTRKLNEIIRSLHIEQKFSKDKILELYLNIVPMSENMYGMGIASRSYFGKEPYELSIAECATLIGIINAPSAYNPYNNPDKCKEKRNSVLAIMKECGTIDETEYTEAVSAPLKVVERERIADRYDSWFVEYVIDEATSDLSKKYGISEDAARMMLLGGGYKVYTTVDVNVQNVLQKYFEDVSNFPDEVKDGLNYAMAVTESKNGTLSGIVGRVGKKQGNRLLNHAAALHTPGSVLKPLALYAPLLDEGRISWSSVFDDVPVSFSDRDGEYVEYPHNSPNVYDGLISVKDALRLSKNTVAVRLCNILGCERAFNILKNDYGFDTLVKSKKSEGVTYTDIAVSPMALGQLTYGVPLVKLVEAYGTFASYGVHKKMRSYIEIRDENDDVVFANNPVEKRIMSDSSAKIMNKMLEEVADSGTAKGITLNKTVPTAAKTGTSGASKDKMLIGYTPFYTGGIWCGYENSGRSVASLSPSHIKIWDEIMLEIHHNIDNAVLSTANFSTDGLIYAPYCMDSGDRYSENCLYDPRGSRSSYGYFTEDSVPDKKCATHILCRYDALGKGVADQYSDPTDIVIVSLLDIPNRVFPKEIFVTDAEFVWRNVSGYDPRPQDQGLPYFYLTLDEGEYAGISKSKKQFNSSPLR